MLPRWHIFLGLIFVLIIGYLSPSIGLINLAIIFLASVLIDIDHYLVACTKTKKTSLFHAFNYHKDMAKKEIKEHKKGLRKRGDFHIFHTIEFHILIALLGIIWIPFFYIFIGLFFHSTMDLVYLLKKDRFYRREFFLSNWLRKKLV